MFVTKNKLGKLVDKFEKWAKEFEYNAASHGIEANVYQHFTGNARAYMNAAQELRKLIRES